MPPRQRSVIHEYGEPLDAEMNVYALEEIVAEKLRAILQHAEKLEHRGWSRSRARDCYDLWRVLRERVCAGRDREEEQATCCHHPQRGRQPSDGADQRHVITEVRAHH